MMHISQRTLHTLEYDKIIEKLADCALTDGARELALRLLPTDDLEHVLARQRRTSDAKRLLNLKGTPSFGMVKDIGDACARADKGAVLSTRELLDVASVLRTSRMLLDYIHANRLFETVLDEVFERLQPERTLEEKIQRAILSEDMIADEASPALADIRRKMRLANNKIKETLQHFISGSNNNRYLQENIITMRNGRYVIPIKTEYKNEVKGLIHDTSSSGATMFIEPMAVVDANNELRTLESKEAHEIERILAELSAAVSACSGILSLNYRNITELAFVFACAELSNRMNAVCPTITEERQMNLRGARHPLIDKTKVVPIHVAIGEAYDTIVITGPNTGGKTVTLKTLGLFALMAQAGLHIPAEDPSTVCIFEAVLVDLGDEQSIEQSLSTFSSHMVNIVDIVGSLTDHSLVLFDELGVGTDPVEGAALAVAVIEAVREAGAICAATTHYAELKAYALQTPGVCNASCEFDVNTLRPTYKLIIGAPGKSNAFAISAKLGLPRAILDRAEQYVSSENRQFEDVIAQLEASRVEMERNREETAAMRAEYERFKVEAEKNIRRREKESEKELEKAREKAVALVESAKASSNYILAQMDAVRKQRDSERLGDALDEARRNLRAHLRENEDKFNPVEEKIDENYVLPRALVKGDEVMLINIGQKGTLLDAPDRDGNVRVQVGAVTTRTKLQNLKLIETAEESEAKFRKQSESNYRTSISRSFRDEIDLRGQTGEDAWFMVDKYLDEANVAGIKSVRLIHGKGTGALRQALQRFLRGDPRVGAFRLGRYGEGDSGVTIVELK
ncbi:MAG: endonuclease MutS2 [Clostridia bacterium]|nr:endonuclease MutS2 [Clostridia bacterium]